MHHVLELLKKDLFVIMKGYMCNYDFFYKVLSAVVLNRLCNYSFSGGLFLQNFSAFNAWQPFFAFESRVEVKLL